MDPVELSQSGSVIGWGTHETESGLCDGRLPGHGSDQLPRLDDVAQVPLRTGEDADVLDRIAVDDEEVGMGS